MPVNKGGKKGNSIGLRVGETVCFIFSIYESLYTGLALPLKILTFNNNNPELHTSQVP